MNGKICTVTLNPTLDITYVVEEISFDHPLKALEVSETPGGKGVNVSRALHSMGTESLALVLIGGYTGDEALHLLREEGLDLHVVRIKNETRTNVVVLGRDDDRELMIRAAGPRVESIETDEICALVWEVAEDPEILVLSGSIPPGIDDDIYYTMIREGNERGVKAVLDGGGGAFRKGLEACPYLIKPNLVELEELAGRRLAGDDEVVEFSRGLTDSGIGIVVTSLGRSGALMVSGEDVWSGRVPPVDDDTVGAGDSMVAGLVTGMSESLGLEEMFKRGLAFGVSAVMNEGPGLTEPNTFKRAYGEVRVDRLS